MDIHTSLASFPNRPGVPKSDRTEFSLLTLEMPTHDIIQSNN